MPERYRPILAAVLLMVLAAPLQGLGETPEKYARRWKRYGDQEVDVLSWRQQKDGTWVTTYKVVSPEYFRPSSPPRRFEQSLGDLVQQGVLTPYERNLIRGGGFDVDRSQQICSSGAFSSRECRELAFHPDLWSHWPTSPLSRDPITPAARRPVLGATPVPQVSLLGVNCTSLMVNRKPAGKGWGKWIRPTEGSDDEQLVVNRCAAVKP